jgi:hypothetical protein
MGHPQPCLCNLHDILDGNGVEDKGDMQHISTLEIGSDSISIEEVVKLPKEVNLTQEKNEISESSARILLP